MRITVIYIILFYTAEGLTQNFDFGLSLGASNYSGDLTENVNSSVKQSHLCIGAHGRVEIDPVLSLNLQFMHLEISGDDQYAKRPGNKNRNLNFNSKIQELSMLAQIQLIRLFSDHAHRLNPYVQFGCSVFHFNPTTMYRSTKVELQPLGTEGQGMKDYTSKYSLYNFSLNIGFGMRYYISSNYSVGLDFLARQTNTDYLDDASTNYVSYDVLQSNNGPMAAELGNKIQAASGAKRASPEDKDWFQSMSIIVSYHFGKKYHYRNPSLPKHQILCPFF